MAIMTHAKFDFNWLMLTLILASGPLSPPGPGERLKRPGLIGLNNTEVLFLYLDNLITMSSNLFV